jgi:hypothetical protein
MKAIRLSQHAQNQLLFRGASAGEVELAIRTSQWQNAESGRFECRREFVFASEWEWRLLSDQASEADLCR